MAAAAVDWVVVQPYEMRVALGKDLEEKLNANVSSTMDGLPAEVPVLPGNDNRRWHQIQDAAEEVRGAIRAGNRVPLSLTAKSVPPEMKIHVLALAAYRMASTQVNLQAVLVTEKGVYAPLMVLYNGAVKELERLRNGGLVSFPTDPEEEEGEDEGQTTSGTVDEDADYSMVLEQ